MNLIRDLEGNEYPLQATITYDKELNGNQSISFRVLPSKVNTFIHDITEMWEVVADTDYKIIYCKKRGSGDKLNVEIKAIPVFFDTFDTQRIYEEYNEHMTAQLCFNRIFQDSGYNVILNGTFNAIQWEGFGAGDTRLTLFKNALNRYKAEFTVSGNTITIENLIGRDTQFMYRYKLNASNIVQENDATAYYTYAKGYGNYSDEDGWQGAKLIREYTSPLAQIIGIRHAPPIQNGNITTNTTMDEQLKILVDESLKISVQANIHDLKDYPLAQPQVGDRSFLIDERIGLETEVRINYLRITKDWQGKIRDIQATFGSPNIVKRHQANLLNATRSITQLLEGKVKLPFSVLDEAVAQATKALKSAQTELKFTENGILAIDKNDPNYVVLLNSQGIGVSTDGGNTFGNAITGNGINANVITVGTMLFDRIAGGTLALGGLNNSNGRMLVYNENGETIADLNAEEGGFNKLYVAELSSPTVVEKSNFSRWNIYVSSSGSDSNDGSSGSPLRTISEAIRRIPKYLSGDVFIYLVAGSTFNEEVILQGFVGEGQITINGQSLNTKITGTMKSRRNKALTRFQNFTLRSDSSYSAFENNFSDSVIDGIKVYGNGTSFAIDSLHGGFLQVQNSKIYDCAYAICGRYGSTIMLTGGNKGYGTAAGLYTYGGYITGYGTTPTGPVHKSEGSGGRISGGFTEDSGEHEIPPPPITEKTQSWNATDSASWTEAYGGVWDNTTGRDVLQGKWGSAGRYRGLWFFGSNPRNAVVNKTIKQIRVKLTRSNNSGYSSSVSAIIRPHGYSSQPSGTPSWLGASHSVGFRWGESKWVTLPSSFHSYFQNGSAYGIMIYTTSTSGSDYMRFTGSATIEITWEE